MSNTVSRRRVLHGLGCAACAGAGHRLFLASPVRAQSSFERIDDAERARLADMALDLARRAGATYSDLRICRYVWQEINTRDGRLENNQTGVSVGFGLRILIDGSWGFAGDDAVDETSVQSAAQAAAENASAMRRLGMTPVLLETLDAVHDDWAMPMGTDPFAVPLSEKIDLLVAINEAARTAGATHSSAYVSFIKEEKFFASSVGSRITQKRVRVAPGFTVTAVNSQSARFASRSSLAAPRSAGWEYVSGLHLDADVREASAQAREKLSAKRVVPGNYDLVIDATNLWLTLHESVGHATELDRALGWEADYAGTSLVTPDQRGKLQFGSPLMNVQADRSQDGGLATILYDDDGVKCSNAGFPIITNGIFQNYQMSIGQAHLIGEKRSNACAYADRPSAFPMQRMPNISLEPNAQPSTLDDLISGVDNGIYIVGTGSWSIDQQRYNFQFGGQLFYEIKNGKRGSMLSHVVYQAQNLAFWNAMDGLGDQSTHFLGGTLSCAKGEPVQLAPVSHGAVAARFRQINVINTSRDDL